MMHKETQKPEKLRAENANDSLDLSEVNDVRHNLSLNITDSSINNDEDKFTVEEPGAQDSKDKEAEDKTPSSSLKDPQGKPYRWR